MSGYNIYQNKAEYLSYLMVQVIIVYKETIAI